jgi:hypothetical protein
VQTNKSAMPKQIVPTSVTHAVAPPKGKGKMQVEVLEEDPEFFKLPLKEQLRIMERDTLKSKGERYGIMTGLEEAAKLGKEPRIPENVFLKNRMQTLKDALKKLRAKKVRDHKAEFALIDRMYLVEREIARAEKRSDPEPPRWDKTGSPKVPASWRHAELDASPPKSPTKSPRRSPPKSPTKSPRRSPPAAEQMDAGLKSALTAARDIIAKRILPNTGGLMAQLLQGVHALIKTALSKGVSPDMHMKLVKYMGYTRKYLENSDDSDDKALVVQLGLALERLAAADQPVRARTKNTSAAPALSPVRKRAAPTQASPVEAEAQPRPVKRTARPSGVQAEAPAPASPVEAEAQPRPVKRTARPSGVQAEAPAPASPVEAEAQPRPVKRTARPSGVQAEAQASPVKRTARPSAVKAEAQASPVKLETQAARLSPARKRPVRVKQGELPASEEAATTDNDRRMVRGLQRAGATTEKGTCPLGPPPEGKACTRGFWQRRPVRAHRPASEID